MKISAQLRTLTIAAAWALYGLATPPDTHGSTPPYEQFIDLGSSSGFTNSQAFSVSGDGSTVIGYVFTVPKVTAARYLISDRTWHELPSLGGIVTIGYGTNYDGSVVVGYSWLSTAANSPQHAFMYRVGDGSIVDLGTLGGTRSAAWDISADGTVIVGESTKANGRYRAFKYDTSSGVMHDLGQLGGDWSRARSVSADGSVVTGFATLSDNTFRAFMYTDATGMLDIGTLGGSTSSGFGVSADGKFICGFADLPGSISHAMIYSVEKRQIYDLGTLPGGTVSTANALSADGSVAVGYSNTGSPGVTHAVKFTTADGKMTDIGTLGGKTSYAYGVSDDGRIITGVSDVQDSPQIIHAFIYRNIMVDVNNTYKALALNASRLNSLLNLQYTGLRSLLDTDCTSFGPSGLCLSVGGRYDHSTDGSRVNDGVGSVRLGYRISEHLRAGVALDLSIAQSMPGNYRELYTDPELGVFTSIVQHEDGTGAQLRLSASGSSMKIHLTRDALEHTEAGIGSTTLEGDAVQGEFSWGWKVKELWLVEPFAGLRYIKVRRNGYIEENSVEFPVSYDETKLETTTMFAGVKARGKVSEHAGIRAAAGVEHDVSNSMDGASGTIDVLGPFAFGAPGRNETRLFGAVGAWYATGEHQQLGLDVGYRRQMIGETGGLQVSLNWKVGL